MHCATDWQDYADHMLAVLDKEPALINQQAGGGFSPRPETRPLTKFEQRGQRLGHGVWDLIYTKNKESNDEQGTVKIQAFWRVAGFKSA